MGIGTFVRPNSRPVTAPAARSKPRTGDLILVAAVAALCIFGLLMVFSASTDFSLLENGDAYLIFNKQVLWTILGGLVALVISRLDYRIFPKLVVPMMGITIALLVVILLIGENRLGSIRTFIAGSIQPSELAKVATVIYLGVWLSNRRESLHDIQLGLLPLAFIIGAIGGLILLQPDLSAGATIFIIGVLMFFLADGELKQILIFFLVAAAVGWLVVQFSDTGKQRIAEYIAGRKDLLNSSDHILYSLESIVNGGFFGQGIGDATLKMEGLPLSATDSIFAVLVEELGLLGVIALISLYGVLVWRGMKIAANAPDDLGRILASGLTFWIAIEALMNMAVMVGLLPFAGNSLPFISAGGSNLLSMLAAIGILVGISRQKGHKPQETVVEQRRSYGASVDLRRGNRRRSISRTRRP